LTDSNIYIFQACAHCRAKYHYLYHISPSVCPSVLSHIPPRLPLDGFKCYVIFGKIQILSKCGKNIWPFTKELCICCFVGDIESPSKLYPRLKYHQTDSPSFPLPFRPVLCKFLPPSARTYHGGFHWMHLRKICIGDVYKIVEKFRTRLTLWRRNFLLNFSTPCI